MNRLVRFALGLGVVMLSVPLVAQADFKDVTLGTISEFQQCLLSSGDFTDAQLLSISHCFETVYTTGIVPPPPDPDPDPDPEPPPTGFAPCSGNQSQAGAGGWDDWCTDESRNFRTLAGGVLGMNSNAEAARNRFPCVNKGVAPPTTGSNRVVMTCDLKFPGDWLKGISLGGQHLFKIGEGPIACRTGGTTEPDHLRFDFGCFNVTNADGSTGNGFKDGFRVLVYWKVAGQTHKETWFSSSTKMPDVFKPDVWTPFRADCKYDPSTGRADLTMTIGGITRTTSQILEKDGVVGKGITKKIGDSIGFGNVDQREGDLEIRNLQYKSN